MKVSELIAELEKCNEDDECLMYITPETVNMDGTSYNLLEPKVVTDNGWDNLVTIESLEVVGDG